MIGIPLDVNDRRDGVLRFVTQRMDDHAAGNGTVRTDAASLRRARYFEGAHLRAGLGEIEAEGDGAADSGRFQETPARKFHEAPPDRAAKSTLCYSEFGMSSNVAQSQRKRVLDDTTLFQV